jgi:hypothetical protein
LKPASALHLKHFLDTYTSGRNTKRGKDM